MSGTHALLSPSGAHRWGRCPGSLALCVDLPSTTSEPAAKGTVQHEIAAECLTRGLEASAYLGQDREADGFTFTVDNAMVANIQSYVDGIRRLHGRRLVEVRLDLSRVLGVPNQGGTSDAIVLNGRDKQIDVGDAKFGYHKVAATGNEQGILYGAGALENFELLDDWKTVKFAIYQPSVDHYDECTYTVDQVRALAADLADAGQLAVSLIGQPYEEIEKHLKPGEVQCKYCPVRANCKVRANRITDMFETLTGDAKAPNALSDRDIADMLARTDEIEGWCRDIRAEALHRALAGRELPGFKVVQGKKGPRKWSDRAEAESMLELLLSPEQMYEPAELITPTAAEKLLKAQFASLSTLVTQADGSFGIAPVSDSRAPVSVAPVQFEEIPVANP